MACLQAEASSKDCSYIGASSGVSLLKLIYKLLGVSVENTDFKVTSEFIPSISSVDVQLPNSSIRDSFVDSYFRFYHPFYPIIHERSFRAQYKKLNSIPENNTFQLLLRMVLTLGTICASTTPNYNDYPVYLSVRERMRASMLESGTIEQIQVLLLMSNYIQKRDKPNTGYNYLGLAARMAIGMGLHREIKHAGTDMPNTIKLEIRRRVWWTLAFFESGASFTFGRPSAVNMNKCEVHIPLNIDDSSLDPSDRVPDEISVPTPYTALIAYSRLTVISNDLYSELFSTQRYSSNTIEHMMLFEKYEKQLNEWKSSIPVAFFVQDIPIWFRGPRDCILWKAQNLRMIMFRRYLELAIAKMIQPIDVNIIESCSNATLDIVYSIRDSVFQGRDDMRWSTSWYATFYLFQSALYLDLLVLICSTEAKVLKSKTKADELTEKCSAGIFIASSVLEVLSSCCSEVADRCHKTSQTIINGLDGLRSRLKVLFRVTF